MLVNQVQLLYHLLGFFYNLSEKMAKPWLLQQLVLGLHFPQQLKGFPGGTSGNKEPACQCRRQKRHRFDPWVGTIPWRRKWHPTPVFLLGKSHGQRNLVGCSPWNCRVGHNWSNWAQLELLNIKEKYNLIPSSSFHHCGVMQIR